MELVDMYLNKIGTQAFGDFLREQRDLLGLMSELLLPKTFLKNKIIWGKLSKVLKNLWPKSR